MLSLKKGQKIRAWVDPPPLIQAIPERKRFFPLMSSLMSLDRRAAETYLDDFVKKGITNSSSALTRA